MHALRLINDEGIVIRECVSDAPWFVDWLTSGDRGVLAYRGSASQLVIPSDHITVEM